MRKKIVFLLLSIFCMAAVLSSCEGGVGPTVTVTGFTESTAEQSAYTGEVANTVETIDFSEIVTSDESVQIEVYSDRSLNKKLNGTAQTLAEGYNHFFIKVIGAKGETKIKISVYRVPMYAVTFLDKDGGTFETVRVFPNAQVSFPQGEPTKEHYEFSGWDVAAGTIITENRTVSSLWTPKNYNLTYDLDTDGVTDNPATYTIESAALTLKAPSRPGYIFTGWSGTDVTGTSQTVTIPAGSTGDRAYTAHWTATAYTISYELNGGTAVNPGGYDVTDGSFTLVNPTKTGYEFIGWSGTDIAETAMTVTIATGSTGDRAYTANWQIVTYIVNFDLNGGAFNTPYAANYTLESDDVVYPTPTKTGYHFVGWSDDGGKTYENITLKIEKGSVGNRTYTAVFQVDGHGEGEALEHQFYRECSKWCKVCSEEHSDREDYKNPVDDNHDGKCDYCGADVVLQGDGTLAHRGSQTPIHRFD